MMYYPQRPGEWDRRDRNRWGDLSPRDRRALHELAEDERELARDYRQAAQRTSNRQLARLWTGYAEEAQRRAQMQQDILRRGNSWNQGGWNTTSGWNDGFGGHWAYGSWGYGG